MTGKPLVGSVVGPTTLTHWGQVLHLPNAYGVVEVRYPDGGARASGIHLLSEITARLTTTPRSLKELEDIVKGSRKEGSETILLCIPVANVLYIVLEGTGDVYLKRGRQFARLIHDSGAISGEIQPGDTLLLASGEFSRALTLEEAGGVFDHLTPAEVAEKLTLILHEKPYGEGSAALVLQFGEVSTIPVERPKKLTQARVFLSHFKPRRIGRHFSRSVLKEDIARLRRHPKKLMLAVTVALILLFAAAVGLGIWRQSVQGVSPEVMVKLTDAQHALDEGVALLSLNPVKGRERLQEAKSILDPLSGTVSASSVQGRQVKDMLTRVNDNLTQSMQIQTVKPDLFFDAGLVKKGATITAIGLDGIDMGLLDTVTGTVIALDITSKKASVLGGSTNFPGMSAIAVHGDAYYVLTSSGINRVMLADNKLTSNIVKKDPQWGTIGALISFGGNLYLLDTAKSRIWKYVATETGFTDTREYLNPDVLPDLTKTNSLAIDGSVWLGSANGRLWKFTSGREDTFTPQGVTPDFGQNLMLYTSDSANNIYVLDADNNRVVVLEKDGTYLAQYAWKDKLTPTALAVSEDQKKIFLLATGVLYTIPLK